MSSLLIEGGRRLSGRISVEGNKNAALPLLAACLLTTDECVLTNMPRIGDVEVMAKLLKEVGADVDGVGTSTLRVRCRTITSSEPDSALVGKLRGSVLLLGPLLARTGRAILGMPGGDFPARRTIGTHVDALVALGARVRARRSALQLVAALIRPRARIAERAHSGLVLSGRGIRHRHRDGAARGCDDRRPY